MGYSNLSEYYKLLFAMVQFHKYSMTEIYEMYPYERDIFALMLKDYIDEQKMENG